VALELARRLRRRDRVLAREAAGTLVLLDLDSGQYFAVDEVSARVWELCDGERTIGAVLAALGEEYDAPEATLHADVLAFLQELVDESLLVSAG
jgi:hypothetical protein